MTISISAHFDLAHPVMSIALDKEKLTGLIDNFAGMFVSYQASRKTGVKTYFTNFEELEFDGAIDVAKKLDKENDIVIVVDTIKESDCNKKPAFISNCYHFPTELIEEMKKQFAEKIHVVDGYFEPTEDETYIYGKKFGLKTFYFGVPIPNDYHDTNNQFSIEKLDEVSEILVELITWLKSSLSY
jgi:hypothetical protein